jgi:hypothetical protein
MSDPTARLFHSYQVPVRTVECVSCHIHFLTRAGSRALLCATCRNRFRPALPAQAPVNPEQGERT